jgi:hypothetical protein
MGVIANRSAPPSSVVPVLAYADVNAAADWGARIINQPTDYPYGERQYTAEDIGGHRWTFTQSIADIDPASWGATSIDLD